MSLEDSLYPLLRFYESAPRPLKSLAGHAYRALPAALRHGIGYRQFQSEAHQVESWSAETIRAYQVTALRASLLAASRSPLYAERFASHGVNPENFDSLDQLAAYPFLTKQHLVTHREQLVNPDFSVSTRLYVTTGGSSGEPVGFYLHKGISRPKEQAYLEAQWMRRGYQPGDRVAVLRGNITTSHSHGSISSQDTARGWLILSSYHLTLERLPEYVAALNRFRPLHLHAYPSAALMLARGMEQTGLKLEFPLTSILCGSEKLSPESQLYLERIFATRVCHWYGHSERAVLAAQGTKSNHLYFWPTYGFVEFGSPNEDGYQEVIGTSFHNHVMPLIRYRTGDYVKLAASPHAELPLMPEVESVAGRDYEFLVSCTGRHISLTAINMHDSVFDDLLSVQFHQHHAGIVEFHYQPGPAWHTSREPKIQAELLRKLGEDFALTLHSSSTLSATPSGKKRWLVSTLVPAALPPRPH